MDREPPKPVLPRSAAAQKLRGKRGTSRHMHEVVPLGFRTDTRPQTAGAEGGYTGVDHAWASNPHFVWNLDSYPTSKVRTGSRRNVDCVRNINVNGVWQTIASTDRPGSWAAFDERYTSPFSQLHQAYVYFHRTGHAGMR